jgi:hypothetical protein
MFSYKKNWVIIKSELNFQKVVIIATVSGHNT